MGSLVYETMAIPFEDRLLAHLQIVVVNKLRRGESFVMSWRISADLGSGRGAIWLDPSIPLYFEFEGLRPPAINREWLARLGNSADSSRGLVVVGEDGGIPEAGRAGPLLSHRGEHTPQ
jgi:hypothetical protein